MSPMNSRKQALVATLLTAFFLLALSVVAYLCFIFPRTLAIWKDAGRTLAFHEQLAVNLSLFCINFGLYLLPGLFVLMMACLIRAIMVAGR